jgi:hypothetical protein
MYASHGGACCGYGHIFTLDGMSVQQFDKDFARHIAAARGENRVCEVILSSRQVVSPPPAANRNFHESIVEFGGWPTFLAARGFRRCATWRNSNTNNMCYQFLHCPEFEESTETDLPIFPTVTLPPPPEVRITRTSRVFNVGDLVVLRTDPTSPFTVRLVRGDGTLRLQSVVSPGIRTTVDTAGVIAARYSTRGEEPAPLDPNLSVAVRDMATGAVFEGTIMNSLYERRFQVAINNTAEYPAETSGQVARSVSIRGSTWYYDRETGNFAGSNPPPLRAFNPGPEEAVVIPRPATHAPEPTVVLEEVFAQMRDGRTRGPFNTEEEAREAYPRVRSFFTRRIFSDGSTVAVDL